MHLHLLKFLRKITEQITIHNRNIQLLATDLFKVKHGLSSPFMNEFPVKNAQHNNLRKKLNLREKNVKTVYNRTETLTCLGPRTCKIVLDYNTKSNSLDEF